MANDPSGANWAFGSPRSMPRTDYFSDPAPMRRNAVGSISQPAEQTQQSVTTGGITNSAGRGRGRKGRGASGLSAPGITEGPNLGIGDSGSADDIMAAAKLGPYGRSYSSSKDDELSAAERMSDADPERVPVTPMTDPDSPLLTRIRAKLGGLDLFAAE